MMIKRNSREVIKQVRTMLDILKAYDIDTNAYMFDETIQQIKGRELKITDFILEGIKQLEEEKKENIGIDENIVEFNSEYIEKFSRLDLNKLQEWQDNLINIVNVEENYNVKSAAIRENKEIDDRGLVYIVSNLKEDNSNLFDSNLIDEPFSNRGWAEEYYNSLPENVRKKCVIKIEKIENLF